MTPGCIVPFSERSARRPKIAEERGRVAGGQRAVELAHALPLSLNDLDIYRVIGARHQVRQDAIVAVSVNRCSIMIWRRSVTQALRPGRGTASPL